MLALRLEPDDLDLIAAAQSGDAAALEALARRWWPQMRRWALIDLHDPVLAEDAAQEALVRLVKHLGRFDASRPFEPWLRTVVRNAATRTRERARVLPFGADPDEQARPNRADTELDLRRARDRVVAAFAALTPRQREVVELCDAQGLRATEAAELLCIAPGTVRALLHQGRRALRARLADLEALLK